MISIEGENFFEDELEEERNREELSHLNCELLKLDCSKLGILKIQALIDNYHNESPNFTVHLACFYKNGLIRNFTMLSEESLRNALGREVRKETDLLLPSQFPLILARSLTPKSIEHCLTTWLYNEAFAANELNANVEVYQLYKFTD